MNNENSLRWLCLAGLWLLLFYLPWWLWLLLVAIPAFKFSYYWLPILPALWFDCLFGLPDAGRFGTQFTLTIGVLLIVWLAEQLKKLLIFYR